jgi:hypothetical protein
VSRRGNPAGGVVRRSQLRPPRLSGIAGRLLSVLEVVPASLDALRVRARLSERQGFFAASELLERRLARLVEGGLRR